METLKKISDYYSEKVIAYGATPKGVDWNGEESQKIRFNQLTKVIEQSRESFTVLDYGSGYGALYDYLQNFTDREMHYIGYDIAEAMVLAGREKYKEVQNVNFFTELSQNKTYDYVIASGIFNVRLTTSDEDWEKYIFETLTSFNTLAKKGFSFNMLTSYSDEDKMRDYLYYAVPEAMFSFTKNNFSKHVALLHDYPLYEFSILVKKFYE